MIWIANVFLFVALWLIGRKTLRIGFLLGVIGSILYAVVSIQINRWDFASFNIAMTLLNGWNLWKAIKNHASSNSSTPTSIASGTQPPKLG